MKILKRELVVMWVAIAVICLMCLRPPRSFDDVPLTARLKESTKIKYTWIWADPPKAESALCQYTGGKVETTLLITQCFVVALLAAGVIVTMRAKRSDA